MLKNGQTFNFAWNRKIMNECINHMYLLFIVGYLFHDGDPYHIETSPLICSANQWISFYMIRNPIKKDLNSIRALLSSRVIGTIFKKQIKTL